MKQFNKINNLVGWMVFAVSAIVYLLTIESTASFWDCGEFITAANKLEVGHPPGAPFFLLVGRLFAMMAPNVESVGLFLNSMSGLASAFTILFLFWTITYFARKAVGDKAEYSIAQTVAILGSGVVGALAYTFSDTFWFSAVEGEVYAFSSLFTAIVFWAILKWEKEYGTKYANRWIILIAYLMGLSIGVHLLNLLAIPAIVFVIYFKRYKPTKKGIFASLLISMVLLGIIMYMIIPGFVKVASWFDLLFVNSFSLPYNSGVLFYAVLVTALLFAGIRYTIKTGRVIANTALMIIAVILLGYSTYAVILIRSSANPPMDQNSPDNVFSLMYYLNREQYGDRPLVKGHSFTSPVIDKVQTKPVYVKSNGKYIIADYKSEYVYPESTVSLFPRMYSNDENHIKSYKQFSGYKGKIVSFQDPYGNKRKVRVPTFGENLKFLFNYQIGHMYFRYFMWNFAGRQNDIQGHGGFRNGNWISGINFIDEGKVGPQDNLPDSAKNNKARNRYYMLPFILGLIGIVYQFARNKKQFFIVSLLFIMTGLAIVVYLNQYPIQPRERDYAYAGSFYAFAIWIGLGVIGLIESLSAKRKSVAISAGVTLVCFAAVPALMAQQNWDDHDRSGRYIVRDVAKNYLESCDENAVLFTYGDNDTFPLWYAQEVEGVRTDIRVSNLSYLGADWYIDQMKRKAYDSDPLPSKMKHDEYAAGIRDAILIEDKIKEPVDLKQAMSFVLNNSKRTQIPSPFDDGEMINYIPSKSLYLTVDKNKVLNNGTVKADKADMIQDTIHWNMSRRYMFKNGMFVYDLVSSNDWDRPIYFAITVGRENYFGLDNYVQLEGLAHRFVPYTIPSQRGLYDKINTDVMYEKFMNKFSFQDFEKDDVYLDTYNRDILGNFRNVYSRLAEALNKEGKTEKAKDVINKITKLIPHTVVPLSLYDIPLIETCFAVELNDKARELTLALTDITTQNLRYYESLPKKFYTAVKNDHMTDTQVFVELMRIAKQNNDKVLTEKITQEYESMIQ